MSADLWQLADLCTPWCVFTVATLRVADHVAAGVERIEEIAAAAKCDPYVLHCVMRRLAANGVFEEPEFGRFVMNEAARGLLDPLLLGLDLNGIGGRMAHAWSTLPEYVRTGRSAYHEIYGRPFFDDLEAHPEVQASFDALIGPAGHGTPSADFDISGGWEAVHSVVDVGGGTGAMLAELLRVRPWIYGTLVDLPGTVSRVVSAERLTTAGQSFFDPLPAGADLYLLRGVVNNWPDREAVMALRRCAEAARPSGRVVVLKSVGEGESRNLTIDMVLTGGKNRSLAEFRNLAQESGLEVVAAGQQKNYYVVECRPVA